LSFFFFQAEDGIRDFHVTGVQTCALPILSVGLFRAALADAGAGRLRPAAVAVVAGVRRMSVVDGDRRLSRPPVHMMTKRLFLLRSEEHTSELQSRENPVCRLLPEKKNH